MSRIESVKGVESMYKYLQGNAGLVGYAGKSEAFRSVVKSEAELMKLYESVLLSGSSSQMYKDMLANIKGVSEAEKQVLARQFQSEIAKDIDLIVKKSHMIKTNEFSPSEVYYNGKSVKEIMKKFTTVLKTPGFFEQLSSNNKRLLQDFLNIQEPNINPSDPNYETKRNEALNREFSKLSNSDLIPLVEKMVSNPNYDHYFDMSSRVANGQIDKKNMPTKMEEYNDPLSPQEIAQFYKLAELITQFKVKGQFDASSMKKELCAQDPTYIDSAAKTSQLTNLDIKTIFSNADKFNKNDLMLSPVIKEGELFAQASDPQIAQANMSYEQAINAIKTGLEEVQAGGDIKQLDPSIVKYVRFLLNNCPTTQFMPNIGLADAHSCRLAKGNEASKVYEPVGTANKYLVDGPRFTTQNIENMLKEIGKETDLSVLLNSNGGARKDILARVMNFEIDERFLTEEEMLCKYYIEDFFRNAPDEELAKYITSKEEYMQNGNTRLTENDIRVLFTCFAEHTDKNAGFKMFGISKEDFEMVDGKPGKMLEKFNCSYDQFFHELYKRYNDAYDQQAIFAAGDDPYTPYLNYIMGYCKDITYGPEVGMTSMKNADEYALPPEPERSIAASIPLSSGSEYEKLLLSLPRERDVQPMDITCLDTESKRMLQHVSYLESQKEALIEKINNMNAKIQSIEENAVKESRNLTADEVKAKSYLMTKIREFDNQISIIDNHIVDLKQQAGKLQEETAKENADVNVKMPVSLDMYYRSGMPRGNIFSRGKQNTMGYGMGYGMGMMPGMGYGMGMNSMGMMGGMSGMTGMGGMTGAGMGTNMVTHRQSLFDTNVDSRTKEIELQNERMTREVDQEQQNFLRNYSKSNRQTKVGVDQMDKINAKQLGDYELEEIEEVPSEQNTQTETSENKNKYVRDDLLELEIANYVQNGKNFSGAYAGFNAVNSIGKTNNIELEEIEENTDANKQIEMLEEKKAKAKAEEQFELEEIIDKKIKEKKKAVEEGLEDAPVLQYTHKTN